MKGVSGSKWLHDGFRHRVSPVSAGELTAAADTSGHAGGGEPRASSPC